MPQAEQPLVSWFPVPRPRAQQVLLSWFQVPQGEAQRALPHHVQQAQEGGVLPLPAPQAE